MVPLSVGLWAAGRGAGRSAGPTSPQASGAVDSRLRVFAAPTELGLGLECQELAVALPLLARVVVLLAPRFLFDGEFREEIGYRGVAPSTPLRGRDGLGRPVRAGSRRGGDQSRIGRAAHLGPRCAEAFFLPKREFLRGQSALVAFLFASVDQWSAAPVAAGTPA